MNRKSISMFALLCAAGFAQAQSWHAVTPHVTTEDLLGCTYSSDAGKWVAVGELGRVLTSANGTDWTLSATLNTGTTTGLSRVTTTASGLAALSTDQLWASSDGSDWSSSYLVDGPITGGGLRGLHRHGDRLITADSNNNKIWVSENSGVSWAAVDPGITQILQAVTGNGTDTYVAVGNAGTILTSSDASNWTPRTSNTANALFDVVYGNGWFVAVGSSGTTVRSSDGIDWEVVSVGDMVGRRSIIYDGTQFVIAAGTGNGIHTSTDGSSWTKQHPDAPLAAALDKPLNALCNNGADIRAVGNTGTILGSSDGIDWTFFSTDLPSLNALAANSDIYVAVGVNGTILTSDNGSQWTERNSGTTNELRDVLWAKELDLFVAIGFNSTLLTSPDGINWTPRTAPVSSELLYRVAWSGTRLLVSGYNGLLFSSTDGTDWSDIHITAEIGQSRIMHIHHAGEKFIIRVQNGPTYASVDGDNWTTGNLGTMAGNGALAWDGIRYTTGPHYSENGISWSTSTNNTSNSLLNIMHDGSAFTGVGNTGTMRSSSDGSSWPAQTSWFTAANLQDIVLAGSNGVIVGENGVIFFRSQVWINETDGGSSVSEDGTTDTYDVVLGSPPSGDVTITIDAGGQLETSPISLIFTSSNWNVPQTVTVSAVDDTAEEGNHSGTITHSVSSSDPAYNGIGAAQITVSIEDNDLPPGVTITQSMGSTIVEESGAGDTIQIVLDSAPTANVTITLDGDSQLYLPLTSLTFTTTNWSTPQNVSIYAIDDDVIEGNHSGQIVLAVTSDDADYDGLSIGNLAVSIADNDSESSVASVGGSGGGGGGAFGWLGLALLGLGMFRRLVKH